MTSEYEPRIERLAARARREREAFDPPASPPAEERAMEYLHEGVGPVVSVYIEGRTGGEFAAFSEREWELLHRALDDWLALYARCYGERVADGFQLRTLAELVVDTHNIRDAVVMLTSVPSRENR